MSMEIPINVVNPVMNCPQNHHRWVVCYHPQIMGLLLGLPQARTNHLKVGFSMRFLTVLTCGLLGQWSQIIQSCSL